MLNLTEDFDEKLLVGKEMLRIVKMIAVISIKLKAKYKKLKKLKKFMKSQ
jgi:hypothetical protein